MDRDRFETIFVRHAFTVNLAHDLPVFSKMLRNHYFVLKIVDTRKSYKIWYLSEDILFHGLAHDERGRNCRNLKDVQKEKWTQKREILEK